jgi:hypothetical protein
MRDAQDYRHRIPNGSDVQIRSANGLELSEQNELMTRDEQTEKSGGVVDGRHFDREIIILCVRWYLRYKLSPRDLAEMMAERGLSLAHTTILRWVRRHTPEFVKRRSRFATPARGVSTRPI